MTSIVFAKLDPGFFWNRKILRAGRNGRDVFLAALCMNAARGALGWIPLADFEPAYLAHVLGISVDDASEGVARALAADLVSVDDDRVTIVGWAIEWARRAKTGAERAAAHRERKRSQSHTSDEASRDERYASRESNGVTDQRDQRDQREESARYARDSLSASPGGSPGDSRSESTGAEARRGTTGSRSGSRRGAASRTGQSSRSATESALPGDWSPPDELRHLALQLGCDFAHELAAFRAHHRATGHRCVDWDARFEKWLRGSRDKGKHKPPKPGAYTTESRADMVAIDPIVMRSQQAPNSAEPQQGSQGRKRKS